MSDGVISHLMGEAQLWVRLFSLSSFPSMTPMTLCHRAMEYT
jgi:hypothetical protein